MHTIQMPKPPRGEMSVTVRRWHKQVGQPVAVGDVLASLEGRRALVELQATVEGVLAEIYAPSGSTVGAEDLLATIDTGAEADRAADLDHADPDAPAGQSDGQGGPGEQTPQPAGDVTPVLMPQVGNTMEEGTILEWKVAEGDQIAEGQVLYEVETDKATVEIEADHAGRLAKIVAPAGQTVPIKEPVAYLAESDADVDAYLASTGGAETPADQPHASPNEPVRAPAGASAGPATPAAPATPATPATPSPATATPAAGPPAAAAAAPGGRAPCSPYARKLASERNVDMTSLRGSGPRGRIVAADVLAAPAGQPGQTGRSASTGAGAQAAPGSGGTLEASMPIAAGAPEPIEVVPGGQTRQTMSKMRRAIASNLLASKQSIPHFYMAQKIDAGPMTAFYRAQKAHYPCSLNDVILAACARALMEFPAFRSRIDGDELVEIGSANIGVAVGTDKGLIVPVLVGTEQMPLPSLAAASKRMVTRAREGKIDGLGQGVFTISNLGMFGIDSFSAIINPPEAAILAVGTTVEEVIVRDGAMRPGKTMTLTLSCDHRVVDGLVAAQFTARLKNLLENPVQLA